MNVYVCEDSPEGIFTGVYDAWADLVAKRRNAARDGGHPQEGHENIRLVTSVEEYELFCSYRDVETDEEKALKVLRTVYGRLGYDAYQCLFRAVCSNDVQKADAVYHTIVEGLSAGSGKPVMNHLGNPFVAKVFELDRRVKNEAGRWIEFLRFKELENGVLYSEIGAQNRILTLLAPHFADRLVNENFVIHDHLHGESIVHEKQKDWALVTGVEIDGDYKRRIGGAERFYQELFTGFCHTISIKERENIRLQEQMLPLKFQKYMTEFGTYL